MLMLGAGKKKVIGSIISILSCRDKGLLMWNKGSKRIAFMDMSKALVCGVRFQSSTKDVKRGQRNMLRFELMMLLQDERMNLYR